MKNFSFSLLAIFFIGTTAHAQNIPTVVQLKKHISYLAADDLEGRLAGSRGARKASNYIRTEFMRLGLRPAGTSGSYFHDFDFSSPITYAEEDNFLRLDKEYISLDDNYFPVPVSGNGQVSAKVVDVSFGIVAPELEHDDYADKRTKKKIFLLNLSSPDGIHPHSKFKEHNAWRDRISAALDHEPLAIILHNSQEDLSVKALRKFNNINRVDIPVIYVEDEVAEALRDPKVKVNLSVKLNQEKKLGKNVLAFMDNGADETVVVGAHYDHLGYGEYGNSRYVGEPAIHNGADDNASGVAAMIEIARKLKKKSLAKNYLFMAFSAEELGLIGSNALVNDPLFQKWNIAYMINLDMVGRLNAKNELGIFGTGTSPAWQNTLTQLDTSDFKINRSPSGMGASDHTSFYLQDIPCLHFFSGTHEDYHKPTDDEYKINYEGLNLIIKVVEDVILELDSKKAPKFQKTKDNNSRKAPSFKVTLGIIPDYVGESEGLKIDGVSPGKPASKAGLEKGDIIIKMGSKDVSDMMTYMQALALFEKGDKTTVLVIRNGEEKSFNVKF